MKNKVFLVTANFSIFLFMLVVLALWSSRLLTEWGSDFGVYYTGAYYLSDDYRLYKELFDHKGPLYYIFLKMVGAFVGWGSVQAYLSLFLTLLTFYIPAFLILLRENLGPSRLLLGVSLCLLLLFGQNTNSSIAFFQGTFLLVSFYFLTKAKNDLTFAYSIIFFVLATFVRIDAVVFLPVYLLYAFYGESNFSYKKTVLRIIFIITIFSLIFYATSTALGFDIYDFFLHNIIFNKWYTQEGVVAYFNRPTHFSIFTSSLIIIPIFLLWERFSAIINETFQSIITSLNFQISASAPRSNFIFTGILLLSFILWILIGSDKDYHILVLTIPLVFIIISNIRFYPGPKWQLLIFLSFALYSIALMLIKPVKVLAKDPDCILNPYCSSSSVADYAESIDFLRSLPEESVSIVGGRGWTYFLADKQPAKSLNDWWLYFRKDAFLTESLYSQHIKLLSGNNGDFFLIDN